MTSILSSSSPAYFDIIIFRHGQTPRNEKGLIQGQEETPETRLNDLGYQQALALGKELKGLNIQRIYTSPSERCKQTAEGVNKHLKVEIFEREKLKGINHGNYDGMSFIERNKQFAQVLPHCCLGKDPYEKWNIKLTGAESVFEVWNRFNDECFKLVDEFLEEGIKGTFAICSSIVAMQSIITNSNYEFGKEKKKSFPLPLFYEIEKPLKNCQAIRLRCHLGLDNVNKIEYLGLSALGDPSKAEKEENTEMKIESPSRVLRLRSPSKARRKENTEMKLSD